MNCRPQVKRGAADFEPRINWRNWRLKEILMRNVHPIKETALHFVPGNWDWLVAAVGITGSMISAWGFAYSPSRTWTALLASSFFFVTLSLGAVVFLSVMYLSNAGWHTAMARVAVSLAGYLPVGAFTVLTVLGGTRWLYQWARPAARANAALAAPASAYSNTLSFEGRMIAVLAIWVAFALLSRRRSLAVSVAFLLILPFSFSVASIDWLMSIDPRRATGIAGLHHVAGLLSAAVAAVSAGVIVLRRKGAIQMDADGLRDLGKLLFAFSTAWACLWFSEFLLVTRIFSAPMLVNVALSWAIPFALLFRRSSRQSEMILLAASVLILAGRWLDIHLEVGRQICFLDAAVFLGLGTAFLFSIDRAIGKAPAARQ